MRSFGEAYKVFKAGRQSWCDELDLRLRQNWKEDMRIREKWKEWREATRPEAGQRGLVKKSEVISWDNLHMAI